VEIVDDDVEVELTEAEVLEVDVVEVVDLVDILVDVEGVDLLVEVVEIDDDLFDEPELISNTESELKLFDGGAELNELSNFESPGPAEIVRDTVETPSIPISLCPLPQYNLGNRFLP
jgi:hypothetical protein